MTDELLVKYLLDEALSAERKTVESWIHASAANRRYFNHFQLIWETSKQQVIPPTVNTDEAWQRFTQRTRQADNKLVVIRRINNPFTQLRAAIIVMLSVGALGLAYFLADRLSNSTILITSSTIPKRDTLPDGSIITLNKNSSISYTRKFKGTIRKVDLKGEAFFSVTPDKKKPFVISVNNTTVTVVGTSFNIKSIGETTQVVVETGTVQVTKNKKSIELKPKEKLVTRSADLALAKEKVTDNLYQYYRTREFPCDNTPLWKLVEVLNEAYNSNIVIENKELRSLPLTATFYNESLEKILSVIAETFDISVEHKNNQIILKKLVKKDNTPG